MIDYDNIVEADGVSYFLRHSNYNNNKPAAANPSSVRAYNFFIICALLFDRKGVLKEIICQ
jgi:hypothetical protein